MTARSENLRRQITAAEMEKLALGCVGVGFRIRPFPVIQPPISAPQERIGSFPLPHAEAGRDAASCPCSLNREWLALVGTNRLFSIPVI